MLVVLAVISIIVSLSTPLSGIYKRNRVSTQVHEFVSALNIARNEAVVRGVTIAICIPLVTTTGGVTTINCDHNQNSALNWAAGWIIFTDTNNNCLIDAGETTLSQHNTLATGFTFQSASDCITYTAQGVTPTTNGMWTLIDPSGEPNLRRGINISVSGRIQVYDCQNHYHENLSCT